VAVGRPMVDPSDLRDMALALTGRPIPSEDGEREIRGALLTDGTGAPIQVRAYADPDLDALRSAITDAEVIQAIGRGRGVNRTAEKPLAVFVMADVVLPFPVSRVVRWEDVRPGVVERMLARDVAYLSPIDAHKAYPDLFPAGVGAAKKALQRSEHGDISLGRYNHRGMSPCSPVRVAYRPAGAKLKTRTALVAPWALDGFRAKLEAMVGPLVRYETKASGFAEVTNASTNSVLAWSSSPPEPPVPPSRAAKQFSS
jgi:hypothetical protein